jgi:hypothetical protein
MGLLSGVSDTVVILPNKVLFVEFKALKKYQRPEQKEFENNCVKLGFPYYVVRSLEQFQEVIQSNLI